MAQAILVPSGVTIVLKPFRMVGPRAESTAWHGEFHWPRARLQSGAWRGGVEHDDVDVTSPPQLKGQGPPAVRPGQHPPAASVVGDIAAARPGPLPLRTGGHGEDLNPGGTPAAAAAGHHGELAAIRRERHAVQAHRGGLVRDRQRGQPWLASRVDAEQEELRPVCPRPTPRRPCVAPASGRRGRTCGRASPVTAVNVSSGAGGLIVATTAPVAVARTTASCRWRRPSGSGLEDDVVGRERPPLRMRARRSAGPAAGGRSLCARGATGHAPRRSHHARRPPWPRPLARSPETRPRRGRIAW